MLRGDIIGLRARHEADVQILDDELFNDVANASRASRNPWRPISPGSAASPHRVMEPQDGAMRFSVVTLADDELAGAAMLWGIDQHNRMAHLGMSLRPAFRGKGLGTDIVRVLCQYGFVVVGLHRLQIDTLADNPAMIKAAKRAGFTQEGLIRETAWVTGEFADEVVLGMLADAGEWTSR